jgi:hypothetical protein
MLSDECFSVCWDTFDQARIASDPDPKIKQKKREAFANGRLKALLTVLENRAKVPFSSFLSLHSFLFMYVRSSVRHRPASSFSATS